MIRAIHYTRNAKERSLLRINPLGPHDALKHIFTCLKTDIISLQLGVLDRTFP